MTLRPIVLLAALGLSLGAAPADLPRAAGQDAPAAAGDQLLRVERDIPGDPKPILLHADQVATWTEGSRRGILLRGHVFVQQGLVQARFAEGIAWVDQEQKKKSQVWHADVYAEGNVVIENGSQTQGRRALLSLTTRGELKMTAQDAKVQVLSSRPDDPLIARGLAALTGPAQPSPASLPLLAPPPPPAPPAAATPPGPRSDAFGKRQDSLWTTAPPRPGAGGVIPAGAVSASASDGPQTVSLPGQGLTPGQPVQTVPPAPAIPAPGPTEPVEPLPPPTPTPDGVAPSAAEPPPPPQRFFSIAPRTLQSFQSQIINLPSGDQALVVTGGVILQIRGVDQLGLVDIEADRLVIWTKGKAQSLFEKFRQSGDAEAPELEVYMAGNVELRQEGGMFDSALPARPASDPNNPNAPRSGAPRPVTRTLRADEVYYNVNRNTAIAVHADLEMTQPGLPDPLHFRGIEVQQLSINQFRALHGKIYSSKLPSDPGLFVTTEEATLEEKRIPRRSIFGPVIDPKTGKQQIQEQSLVTARNVFVNVGDVPVFWLPWSRFDARDPLGPLDGVSFGWSRIYGFQLGATLDIYDLLGIDPLPGTRWRWNLDYLSERGPGMGTDFQAGSTTWFGLPGNSNTKVFAWGLRDTGEDILGGGRGKFDDHPLWRGWANFQHIATDLPAGFSVQAQVSALSDKNFLEQYYKPTFDLSPNQETFLYITQQGNWNGGPEHETETIYTGNWAWSLLGETRIRNWVTETEWLPRADGWLIGQTFFDRLTYTIHGSAGYAQLKPTDEPPPPLYAPYPPYTKGVPTLFTDQPSSLGRFDLWQEVSLPFRLGPITFLPYGVLDLTQYTSDLRDDQTGRIYGGGGVRASLPLSRLYPNLRSEWLNVNGIYHKTVTSVNYYVAETNVPFTDLPQLDRINDDATDQSQRDIRPIMSRYNQNFAADLAANPALYDPQVYAIRRLVDNRTDTLDDIQVLQVNIRNRWQTKRGYPGQEHVVDWATFEMGGSYFPNADRDNFGEPFAFLEYDWLWNVGDRNGFYSRGWLDPIDGGARVFTIGAFFERPDRTNWQLGFRYIDPVGSRAVTAAFTYIFSPKYGVTASSTYDFGTRQALSNSLMLTRIGADLQMSFGVTYNAMQNNFGVMFQIMPNLLARGRTGAPVSLLGNSPGSMMGGNNPR